MAHPDDRKGESLPRGPFFRDTLASIWHPKGLAAIVVAGEAFALVLALSPGRSGDPVVYFGLASLLVQWTLLGSVTLAYLLRNVLSAIPERMALWSIPVILVAISGIVGQTATLWLGTGGALSRSAVPTLPLMGIAFICGMVGAALLDALLRLERQRARAERAEYEALRARVRPHFLFNTLNTAISLARSSPQQAEHVLLALSDLFRASLAAGTTWPLSREIEITRAYLDIEQARLGERLSVNWTVPESAGSIPVPRLLLQALAENAVQHGIEPLPEGGLIQVSARVEGSALVLEISNPAPPENNLPSRHLGHRIGLSAARQRLTTLPQGEGRITTRHADGCFVATVALPLPAQATTR
ncbi:sensor histidine kinase [Silanimonas lenta]|uniref:sensor histidine kinase n=1 Tax=Silanimonas lenta TaxID=265429 RepID=UPI002FE02443